MNRSCHQLLASATFAGNQHRHVGRCHPPDHLVQILHRRAPPEQDAGFHLLHTQGHAWRLGYLLELQGFTQQTLERRHIDGFEQIVVGPELHRRDGGVRGAVGCQEDHRQRRGDGLDALQRF